MMRRPLPALIVGALLCGLAIAAPKSANLLGLLAKPPATGLLITLVAPGTPAQKARLKRGDIIVSYGGAEITDVNSLLLAVQGAARQKKLEVRYHRGGKVKKSRIASGQLGVQLVPLVKGIPVPVYHPETKYEPDMKAIQPGETWYDFTVGGKKVGYEHHVTTVTPQSIKVVSVVRFRFPGYDEDMRMEQELRNGPQLTLTSMRYFTRGSELANLRREGERMVGTMDGKSFKATVPSGAVATWAVPLLIRTMPRKAGACLHVQLLSEANFSLGEGDELLCKGEETVRVNDVPLKAWRYELRQYGATGSIYWVDGANRIVKADYGGPVAVLTTREQALRGLPPGVRTD